MGSRYILDENDNVRKERTSVWAVIRKVLMFFVVTLSLSVLYYAVFSIFISTDSEKKLIRENRMYEKVVPQMEQRERLLSDVIEGLEVRDNGIYGEIFHTAAPSIDPLSTLTSLSGLDTIPDTEIVMYSANKLEKIVDKASAIEENFRIVAEALSSEDFLMPPMTVPVGGFSFARTGASVGEKINPFYKVPLNHEGLDIISSAGEPVFVSADGVVTEVVRSRKGLGNVVTVEHPGGYVTRYAHLSDIYVGKGRLVKRGMKIGCVGVSGNSFAPHLHYEVRRDTVVLNPVNYCFGSLDVDDYVNMMVMASSTGQSLD